jgi:anti-sigma B factor antagonist
MPFRQQALDISRYKAPDQLVLVISGELDLGTAPQLLREVAEALSEGHSTVHLDLSGVSFIDCAGLRALIIGQRDARRSGRKLLVARTSAQVDRLRDLTSVHLDFVEE